MPTIILPPGVRMTAALLQEIVNQCGICNPCLRGSGSGGGSGSGSGIVYTDCRCSFEWNFDPESPVKPPQPPGSYFPTILYYEADYSGDCADCYFLNTDNPPCAVNSTLTTATVSSYCSGRKSTPLYLCPFTSGGDLVYEGYMPLCDVTMTFSTGDVITFRKYVYIQVILHCATCGVIDESWLVDNGLDPELYADWIGLEYCNGSTADVTRQVMWSVLSQSLSGGATVVSSNAVAGFGGQNQDMTTPCDTTPCTGTGGIACSSRGGRISTKDGSGLVRCTDVFLQVQDYVGGSTFAMAMDCCKSNPFPSTLSSSCCLGANEVIRSPC